MEKYRCTITFETEEYSLFENTKCVTIEIMAEGLDKIKVISDVKDMKDSLMIRKLDEK